MDRSGARVVGVVATLSLLAGLAACGSGSTATAQMTSNRRSTAAPPGAAAPSGAEALCDSFSTISAQWSDDPLGPEMTAALDQAIASVPPEVAAALGLVRDELWLTPDEAVQWDAGAALDAQRLIDRFAVETCGVSVFDPRVTPDMPEVPTAEETPQTDLGVDYLSDRQAMMTEAGGIRVRWEMPRINLIDGPRQPKTMSPPAIVTYWAYGGVGVPVRYDAMLLANVGNLGANDDAIARAALLQIGGGAPIHFEPSRRSNGRLQIDFVQQYDNRVYLGRAYSWAGNVFALTVAVPWNREDLGSAATTELARLTASVSFEPL